MWFNAKKIFSSVVVFCSCLFFSSNANAIDLAEAVEVAVESNPEIGQAVQNREAIEFELRQARGLYLPSIDLESAGGVRRLDSPSRSLLGFDDDLQTPVEGSLVLTQTLYNGGQRRAERDRQASRVDSASFRILERSEDIGLQVVREYLEYLLQNRIINQAAANLSFHKSIRNSISSAISAGTLTEADRQQVSERLFASEARLKEAQEALNVAENQFIRLVGKPIGRARLPGSVAHGMPKNLPEALGSGRKNNPRIKLAEADVDVADALVKAAEGRRLPEVFLETRGRAGRDIDGSDGRTTDLEARVVARWNIFRGGIDKANKQEQIRRASEQRLVLHQMHREVDQAIRAAWNRRIRQRSLSDTLKRQARENSNLVSSYRQQFSVGQRSLLDVLDAQNTNFNVNVLATSADFAALFADYQLLAASGRLLRTLSVTKPQQSKAYAREEFDVPPTPVVETQKRQPSRQVRGELPLDILAPLREKNN